MRRCLGNRRHSGLPEPTCRWHPESPAQNLGCLCAVHPGGALAGQLLAMPARSYEPVCPDWGEFLRSASPAQRQRQGGCNALLAGGCGCFRLCLAVFSSGRIYPSTGCEGLIRGGKSLGYLLLSYLIIYRITTLAGSQGSLLRRPV